MCPSRATTRLLGAVVAIAALTTASGCRHDRDDYMWVGSVPKGMNAVEASYRIAAGDVISIQVFNQPAHSVDRVRVREDGKISLPFLNDVDAAGAGPAELAQRLQVRLKTFITNPMVNVVVNERRPLRISVVGKVTRPGVYDLDQGAGVIHALAAAGGLTPFAHDDRVYVLRAGYWSDGEHAPARIRFRYADLAAGKAPAALFYLRIGDVVVVE